MSELWTNHKKKIIIAGAVIVAIIVIQVIWGPSYEIREIVTDG